jgi:RNA polymerase sigma-70 factor (ECF subfamily)
VAVTNPSELYRRYSPDVFRFALHLSGDRHEAEDITSETFVRAWTSPEPIRMATVKGYLFTIARNLYLRGARKRRRQVELGEELRDPGPGPQTLAEQASSVDRVLAQLQKLPEIDRAALLMRAMDELPYDEIARALGITLSSAKVKIHRARLALLEWKDQ